MESFDPDIIDARRKEFDFACRVFETISDAGHIWIEKPEYRGFGEKKGGKYEPMMQFESADSGECFRVDAFYRERYDGSGGIRVYPEEDYFERMRDYDELGEPIFVAVGIGGPVERPYDFLFGDIFEFAFHTITSGKCRELETKFGADAIRKKLIF